MLQTSVRSVSFVETGLDFFSLSGFISDFELNEIGPPESYGWPNVVSSLIPARQLMKGGKNQFGM